MGFGIADREEPACSEFGLRVEQAETGIGSGPALVFVVDGEDLFGRTLQLKGVGRDPDSLLGRSSPLLPTDWPEQPRTTVLRRCNCGIEGCGFASARIQEDRYGCDHVVWSDFTLHCMGDVEPPTELRFRTAQYVAEIVRCHADRSRESTARRIAREVAGVLDADPGILGQWGLGLRRAQPHDWQGEVSMLVTDGAADYMTSHGSTDDAATIIARLRSADPRESAEHTYPRLG
ncbi:hypothetical protein OOZ19_13210 [Saccharopolyspora sp. NFXS83]|uniref:hypothetical protein n=1 Tax=Saccharopolyspora sp. NFXS83 TaxID=2993560 RepID=UPI00224B7E10|nr:hypothetical protein [Saccharopolyspora sp. NFXS83]MCX2731204.1 hypothetical protein [Saccharopolyspora sp. NFXS83]